MHAFRIIMIGAATSAMLTLAGCNRPQPADPAADEAAQEDQAATADDQQTGDPEQSARAELLSLVDTVARIRRDAQIDPSRLPDLLAAAGMTASELEEALYAIAEDAEASALYAIMAGARATNTPGAED